ncbi:MAG: (2Fe-2S) ferredoxin domain-containing protein [Kiritimatiellae bacterium]|nr:(2Fe-2S) ferredoxin domain-containing protein [Kiritimatiellia bacterium]
MAKLTLDELRKIREEKRVALEMRESTNKNIHVIVGMDTCGIAAGAKAVFSALIEEITEKGLSNVLVRQSRCMGFCASEPTVEVVMPEMPAVIYGKVDAATAKEIVEKHILGHELIEDKICDRPSIENVTNG